MSLRRPLDGGVDDEVLYHEVESMGVAMIAQLKGAPLNHGVRIDGKLYAVPCGNLVKVRAAPRRIDIKRPVIGGRTV